MTCLRHAIIVLGMHRSGTSLIAELIDKWGAFGGDEFLQADARNPRGYWEYAPLVHFNRRLLMSVGSQSFVPPSDQQEIGLRTRTAEPEWNTGAARLMAAMDTGGRPWYWKDPRFAVMLPFWQEFWTDPIYVIAIREALDTALSLKKRDHLPLSAGLLLWQRYMTAILKYTDALPRRIFIKYERILSAPAAECKRLSGFLQQHCGEYESGLIAQREVAMVSAVSAELRSHASQAQFLASTDVTDGQKNLYRYLQACLDGRDEPLDAAGFELYPGWRDYLQTLATLRQTRENLAQREHALLVRIQKKLAPGSQANNLPW